MKHLKIIEAVGQYDNKQGVISAIKNYQDKKQGKPIKILVIHFLHTLTTQPILREQKILKDAFIEIPKGFKVLNVRMNH
jgi:transcriptional regulator of met regulon